MRNVICRCILAILAISRNVVCICTLFLGRSLRRLKMKMKTRVFISVFILSDLTGPKSHQKWVNLDLSFHFFFPNKQTHLFDYSKNWKWKLYMVTFIWRWKLNTAAALLSTRRFWFQFPFPVRTDKWKLEKWAEDSSFHFHFHSP